MEAACELIVALGPGMLQTEGNTGAQNALPF
jgi:hypothetical protein